MAEDCWTAAMLPFSYPRNMERDHRPAAMWPSCAEVSTCLLSVGECLVQCVSLPFAPLPSYTQLRFSKSMFLMPALLLQSIIYVYALMRSVRIVNLHARMQDTFASQVGGRNVVSLSVSSGWGDCWGTLRLE